VATCMETQGFGLREIKLPPSDVRSDSLKTVLRRLQASSYLALRTIECDDQCGVMILRGRVPTFFLKQIAQELIRGLPGVETIANLIDVRPAVDQG
jgi:BON domain